MAGSWDDRAFRSGLQRTMNRLEKSSAEIPERMVDDMVSAAKASVARNTGATAASIEGKKTGKDSAELTADNSYLELGTSKMPAQPFVRPARAQVIAGYRAGRYKPEL